MKVDLGKFSSEGFDKGAPFWKIGLWYFVNTLFVRPSVNPFMAIKILLLHVFGMTGGGRICLKPGVIIKSPWNLSIWNNCWIGENVWIDNLDKVTIGNNVCISQGAMLLTGNHDYSISWMPYRNAPITIQDGAWVGCKCIVCPGVTVHRNAVLCAGSVATKDLEENGVYQGNPAVKIRNRNIVK